MNSLSYRGPVALSGDGRASLLWEGLASHLMKQFRSASIRCLASAMPWSF